MAGTTFSTSNWDGYDEATVSNPSSVLTDFSLLIDVSRLSLDWKSNVQTDGDDIRITKGDDTELAFDLIDWNYNAGSPTGWIRVKWSGSLASSGTQSVKIWAGYNAGGSAIAYSSSETYGSDNAYDSSWEVYYPLHDLADRTSNNRDLTAVNSPTVGSAVGKAGAGTRLNDGVTNQALTFTDLDLNTLAGFCWINTEVPSSQGGILVGGTNSFEYQLQNRGPDFRIRVDTNSGAQILDSTSASSGAWEQIGFVFTAGVLEIYYNGTREATTTPSGTSIPDKNNDWAIGNRSSDLGFALDAIFNQAQIHSDIRSADWWKHEHDQSDDQSTFWGTWSWNASGGGATESLTDTITFTTTVKANYGISVSSTLSLLDLSITGISVEQEDTISIEDETVTQTTVSIIEQLSLLDTIEPSVTITVSDEITLTDAITTLGTPEESLSETVSLQDSTSGNISVSLTESLSFSDTTSPSFNTSLLDSLSFTTSLSPEIAAALADGLSLIDVSSYSTEDLEQIEDPFIISDELQGNVKSLVNEVASFTETVQGNITVFLEDSFTFTDILLDSPIQELEDLIQYTTTVLLEVSPQKEESFSLGDTLSSGLTSIVNEVLSFTDNLTGEITLFISDSLLLTDAFKAPVTFIEMQLSSVSLGNMALVAKKGNLTITGLPKDR